MTGSTRRVVTIEKGLPVQIGGAQVWLPADQPGPVNLVVAELDPAGSPLVAAEPGVAGPADELPFRKRYSRPVACSAAQEAQVRRIATTWSSAVRRITVLNQPRFSAVFARLDDGYAADEIIAAIRVYGRDEWHRKNAAWLDIAAFMRPAKLDHWLGLVREKAAAAEKRRHARAPVGPDIARAARQIAQSASEPPGDDERLLAAEFSRRPVDVQRTLVEQAVRELVAVGIRRPGLLRPTIDNPTVRARVLIILRRQLAPEQA